MTMTSESDFLTGIGRKAPALAITEADREFALDRMRGEYVLLNFWNSTDAASRVAANKYDTWVARHPDADVCLLSVNFDRSEAFFHEIVRRDGMNEELQYHADDSEARQIRKDYALKDGYGTLLINPEGKIIAHNPTPEELERIFA